MLNISRKESYLRKGSSPEKAVASSRLSLGQLRATKGFCREGKSSRERVGGETAAAERLSRCV